MRYSIIALAAAAGLAFTAVSTASAADLPRSSSPAPASYAAPFTWTGFYLGGNLGYGWGGALNQTNSWDQGSTLDGAKGAVAGIEARYLNQTGKFVWGIGVDYQWSGVQVERQTNLCQACYYGISATQTDRVRMKSYGTARGIIGLDMGRFMPFLTGGLAFGDFQIDQNFSYRYNLGYFSGSEDYNTSFSRYGRGYVLGGGVEAYLGGNWTAKLQYDYLKFGIEGQATNWASTWGSGSSSNNTDFRTHIVKFGANYRF